MVTHGMQTDIRETSGYREAEALFRTLRQPGTGQISDAAEAHVSPDGLRVVFAGELMDKLEGVPTTRIGLMDIATADTRVLTFGPNVDRLPKFSPDGGKIAFLSDREKAQDFQLHLLYPVSGAVKTDPACRWLGRVSTLVARWQTNPAWSGRPWRGYLRRAGRSHQQWNRPRSPDLDAGGGRWR